MTDRSRTWPVTWEANRQVQRAAILAASPAERLAWLEEMIALAYRAGALNYPAKKTVAEQRHVEMVSTDWEEPEQ
jgi:hypothetical protein